MSTLGSRLRKARENAGLSQRALAKALDVSDASVGHWERDIRRPKLEAVQQIARITFADAAALLCDPDVINPKAPKQARSTLLPDELRLLRIYRKLTDRQRKNLMKLLDASLIVRHQIEGGS